MLTGKVEEICPGVYEYALSTHNMQRIVRAFSGPKKPVVVSGHQFLDGIKAKLEKYKQYRSGVQEVLSKERYPVPPNGKFVPYAHQTKVIGIISKTKNAAVCLDCGLGKTGSLGRSFELCIESGEISRGKILVSAPLSILHTSWSDDLAKFTNLRSTILWCPEPNKKQKGEEKITLGNYSEKPNGSLKSKQKIGVLYRNNTTGETREVITSLDSPHLWTKYEAKWKEAVMLDGSKIPYGPIIGQTVETLNTREQYIKNQLARTDIDVFLINHDGVRIYEDILKDYDFEWVVVDESTKIKSPKSDVFKAHVNISWKSKRRNIMSGTPNPNGFTDLWSQYYFLDRGMTLEPTLKDFLFEYFRSEIVGYVMTPKGKKAAVKHILRNTQARDALINRVRSVGIFLEQRDCLDLPPRTDMRRVVFMTPEQESAYDRMAIELVTELKNNETGIGVKVDATNVLAKIMKLRQITSGFLIGKDGSVVHMSKNPKLEDLDDFVEELGERKVVLAAQFREEVLGLAERYSGRGARAIFGDVPVEERASIIRDFQSNERAQVIVLQPAAAAHGITLTAASQLVFISLDYNFEYYYQTAKRIERLGQKNPIFITHMLAQYRDGSPTIDEDLMDILANKNLDRNALFDTSSEEEVAQQLSARLIRQVERRHGQI
jgi:SNF2 family DNA or RNA helicase